MTAGNPDQEDPTLVRTDAAAAPSENSLSDQTNLIATTIEVSAAEPPIATADQLADNDVLAALTSVTPDIITNLEHTFDQLVSTTDLFDVPSIDFDGAADS
jgi:hypothetical protein